MLGHKNSTITRSVYVQEVKTAERRAMLRARMEARHEGLEWKRSGSDRPQQAAGDKGWRGGASPATAPEGV